MPISHVRFYDNYFFRENYVWPYKNIEAYGFKFNDNGGLYVNTWWTKKRRIV